MVYAGVGDRAFRDRNPACDTEAESEVDGAREGSGGEETALGVSMVRHEGSFAVITRLTRTGPRRCLVFKRGVAFNQQSAGEHFRRTVAASSFR